MSTSPIAPLVPVFAFSHRPASGTARQGAPDKTAPTAATPDAAAKPGDPENPRQISPLVDRRLTGPPPAFQLSLLEVETQLDTAIKRLEQARAEMQAPPGTDTQTDP
jgi:hypothetical protein